MTNTEEKWKNHNGNINICSDIEDSDIPKLISEKTFVHYNFIYSKIRQMTLGKH